MKYSYGAIKAFFCNYASFFIQSASRPVREIYHRCTDVYTAINAYALIKVFVKTADLWEIHWNDQHCSNDNKTIKITMYNGILTFANDIGLF